MDMNYFLEMQLDLMADIKGELQGLRRDVTSVAEAMAGIRAEVAAPAKAVIAKAQDSAKATPAPIEDVDAALLVKLAAEKSKSAGADAVKGVIAGFAPKIKDVPSDQLVALKDALEALA